MPSSSQPASATEELLAEASELEMRASQIQNGNTDLRPALIEDYLRWFSRCLSMLPADLQERFRGEYEGSAFTSKIRAFLEEPTAPNPFYDPDKNPLGLTQWKYPFERHFSNPLLAQRQLLIEASHRPHGEPERDVLLTLEQMLRQIGDFFTVLANRQRGREGYQVEDEYDVQDALHAILRLHFRDVRPEEWTPSYAGGSTRTDFLLKVEQVFVETKMTRKNLGATQARTELAEDIITYKSHPDCEALFALIYDPTGMIPNRYGFEADLSGSAHGIPVRVIVVP